MSEYKKIKNTIKDRIGQVKITEEQVNFLLDNYLDEDSILGIHNTIKEEYRCFFENGIYNNNDWGKKSKDISNTVNYSDNIMNLMTYPSGFEPNSYTALIVKIPKDVFLHKQGIFETLKDNHWGIPPQFIVGALQDGNIIINANYDKQYKCTNAVNCSDKMPTLFDRNQMARIFQKIYYKKRNSFIQKALELLKTFRRKSKKVPLLPKKEEEHKKNFFKEELKEGVPSKQEQARILRYYRNKEEAIEQITNEDSEKKNELR